MREDQPEGVQHSLPVNWGTDGELHWAGQQQPANAASDGTDQTARLVLQELLQKEIAPLRESIDYLAARREQDEASLRAALLKWSDQVAHFRSQVEDMAAQTGVERAKLEATAALIQQQVAMSGQLVRQVESQQEVISRLREANTQGAAQIERIRGEQNTIVNQLMSRVSGVQSELGQQLSEMQHELQEERRRSRSMLIGGSVAALAFAVIVVILIALLLSR